MCVSASAAPRAGLNLSTEAGRGRPAASAAAEGGQYALDLLRAAAWTTHFPVAIRDPTELFKTVSALITKVFVKGHNRASKEKCSEGEYRYRNSEKI